MELDLIAKTCWRRLGLSLAMIIQTALAFTAINNCVSEIRSRLDTVRQQTGIELDAVVVVETLRFSEPDRTNAAIDSDLLELKQIPGVTAAAVFDSVPLGEKGTYFDFRPEGATPSTVMATYMKTDEFGLASLGIALTAGRSFVKEEIGRPGETKRPKGALPVILSPDLAKAVFGSTDVLGRTMLDGFDRPYSVVGITAPFIGQQPSSPHRNKVMFRALFPTGPTIYYAVHTTAGNAAAVIQAIGDKLESVQYGRAIVRIASLREFAAAAYRTELEIAAKLTLIGILTIIAVAAAIAGISLLVAARERTSNGVRRALGASRSRIVATVLLQNMILAGVGIIAGIPLAVLTNDLIRAQVEFSALATSDVLYSILLMAAIAQAAALWPAIVASRSNPAAITKGS